MTTANPHNAAFVCRKCGKTVSSEEYKLDRCCSFCGTFLMLKRFPKHWLFQFSPKVYRWLDRIKDTQEPEQWLVSQHSKYIQKDDEVAIWASGTKAGIYALGQITSNPSKTPLKDSQKNYWIDKSAINKFLENKSVTVVYAKIQLDQPILEEKCHNSPCLSGLQVFNNPQGTNFSVSYEQWQEIIKLI